ncbi:hypothetical protein CC78DRAFT_456901 [Lojkania enalia]|uniref:RING-type E3 ubiquitin transferase n=1 Tax=Lojkania enalia TaxID=147567 RepID=A0A9P4N2T0_9PLEO|nr:hypothetical protein CC78DRAFT_456901 [Didymosphaeria enalia]
MEATASSSKDDSGDACVICLSPISERAVTVPCNHTTFDFICLASWLQQKSACPLCKTEVRAVQYDWRSPSDFRTFSVRSTEVPRNPAPAATAFSTSYQRSRYRLPRRPHPTRQPYSPPDPDTALLRRRFVYRHQLYSYHVGTNRLSRYQDLTPEMVTSSPELQSRAKMFIRRELRVFSFLDSGSDGVPFQGRPTTSSNAEFLLTYIVAILKAIDLKESTGHAEELLSEFLGRDSARLFLHELNAWLRSPYTKLEDWDRHVQYRERLPYAFGEGGRPVFRGQKRRVQSRSPSPGLNRRSERGGRDTMRRHVPD